MVNGFMPATLEEALQLLSSDQQLLPYAGGTDLMVQNRLDVTYLFIAHIPELRRITVDENYIRIGAAVTFAEALRSELVPPIMKEAVRNIASPAIRNAATFGGNIGNGSPKADSVVVQIAADAKLRLVSLRGERIVDVERFYLRYKTLDLAKDELIAEILLPNRGLDHFYFEKVGGRSALAISNVSFAGVFAQEEGRITNVAAAFGAIKGTILRFRDLEAMFLGKTVSEAGALKEEYLKAYAERLDPDAWRVSAEYSRIVCINLLREFLTKNGI